MDSINYFTINKISMNLSMILHLICVFFQFDFCILFIFCYKIQNDKNVNATHMHTGTKYT